MRALRLLVPVAALALGCGRVEAEPAVPGPGDEAGGDPSPSGEVDGGEAGPRHGGDDAGATTTSLPGSSIPSSPSSTPVAGSGNEDVIIASTNVDEDGAIAADDMNVYWVQLGDDGVSALMSCPVSGCDGSAPREVWGAVNAGSVPGELLVEEGLVYFQTTEGTLVDCPEAGCGSAPNVFVPIAGTSNASASMTSDGQNLYWEDAQTLFTCPLGVACAHPVGITHLSASVVVAELVVNGSNLYWVDRNRGDVESVPLAGGEANTLCNVPEVPLGLIGGGAFAIVGGYAYVATAAQMNGASGGIYRCSLSGGTATLYSSGSSVISVDTDGASLFWLAGDTTGQTTLYVCLPGESCTSPATFLGPVRHMEGFSLYGNYVYTVAPQIEQTTKTY